MIFYFVFLRDIDFYWYYIIYKKSDVANLCIDYIN